MKGRTFRPLAASAALSLAFLAACASGTNQVQTREPVPCADTVYLQLGTEHPDSLSEREWQRLQALENVCAAARAEASRSADHRPGADLHRAWWLGSGLVMALMMVAMGM